MGFNELSVQKKQFYILWKAEGFDPVKRDECLAKAGYSQMVIRNRGGQIEKSINGIMLKSLMRKGVTPDYMAGKLKENMNSMHPRFRDSPDNIARNQALKMGLELYDAFPNPKIEIEKRELIVSIAVETLKDAEKLTGEKIIDVIPEEAFIESEEEEVGEPRDNEPVDSL